MSKEQQSLEDRLHQALADGSIDVSRRPFVCDSWQGQIRHMQGMLSFALKWSSDQFELPSSLDAVLPFISRRHYRANAFAVRLDSQAFFGYELGLAYAITDACTSLAHHHQFLPALLGTDETHRRCHCSACGGPRLLPDVYSDYSWLTGESPEKRGRWVPIVTSSVQTPRSVVGDQLCALCLQWTAGHELGHVLLGHVNWDLSSARHERPEALAHHTDEVASILYYAELEADQFATAFALTDTAGLSASLEQRFSRARDDSPYDGPWPADVPLLADLLIYIVPLIMHGLFAKASGRRYAEAFLGYPSAAARKLFMHNWILASTPQYRQRMSRWSEEELWNSCVGAVFSVFEYWNGLDRPMPGDSLESELIVNGCEQMVARFGTARDRLKKRRIA